jgi:hypothetical protein
MNKIILTTILHCHLLLMPLFYPHFEDSRHGFMDVLDTPSWGHIVKTQDLEQPDGVFIQGEIKW